MGVQGIRIKGLVFGAQASSKVSRAVLMFSGAQVGFSMSPKSNPEPRARGSQFRGVGLRAMRMRGFRVYACRVECSSPGP